MRQAVEIAGFLSLAAGLHLAVFALTAPPGGGAGAGAEGRARVTLAAAPAGLAGTVAEWDRGPAAATEVAAAQRAPVAPAAAPTVSPPETAPAAPRRMSVLAPAPAQPARPTVETTPPPRATPDVMARLATPAPPSVDAAPRVTPRDAPAPGGARATPRMQAPRAEPAPRLDTAPAAPPPPEVRPAAEAAVAPKPRPVRQASVPVAPQKAAGPGAARTEGATVPRQAALTRGERATLMAAWGGQIRVAIERAKRGIRGGRGRAMVELTVTRGGRLAGVRVVQSSGDAALDRAAVAAVQRAGAFPPAPDRLPGQRFPFRLPVRFEG
ncbi:TonB family protein [Rhodovulum sp. YNF3179]|uniref:TonB family protein n=1 Tax=Rhodovulum sp. YNF3179 TaxID=3425127 RepID=UPI003D33AA2A